MIVCMCVYLHIYFSSSFLQSASSNWFIYNMAGFLLSHPKGTQEHSTSNIWCSAKIRRNSHFIYFLFFIYFFSSYSFLISPTFKKRKKKRKSCSKIYQDYSYRFSPSPLIRILFLYSWHMILLTLFCFFFCLGFKEIVQLFQTEYGIGHTQIIAYKEGKN